MSVNEIFASAFLAKRPQESARLLESIDARLVADVFEKTPAKVVAQVVQKMLPLNAARCLEQLPPPVAAEIIELLPPQCGAAIFRQFSAAVRDDVLRKVGNTHSLALKFLLNYPEAVVGAWMDPAVFTIASDINIEESRRQYDRAQHPHQKIIVLDRDRHVCGAVDVRQLFRADKRRTIASLLEPIATIRARETIAVAQQDDAWETESQLPVLNRHGEFVGVVTYADLRRGQRFFLTADHGTPAQTRTGVAELLVIGMESVWDGLEHLLVDTSGGHGEKR